MLTVLCQPIFLNILSVLIFMSYAYARHQPSPNCSSSCGGVNIPYPFGIGEGCYRDRGFQISCEYNKESSRYIPYVGEGEMVAVNISEDQVRVRGLVSTDCYDEEFYGLFVFLMNNSPLTFSDTQNRFSGFGCNIFAYITEMERFEYKTGCVSLCPTGVSTGSCSGIGCCQTTIPKGLKSLNVSVDSMNTTDRSWWPGDQSCRSYVALIDRRHIDSTQFNITQATSPSKIVDAILKLRKTSTTVLDWAIGDETCKEAKRNSTSFACIDKNSHCIDSTNGPGYRCYCSRGFTGNPYLRNGCEDIDECKNLNNCIAACVNIPGSYYCRCPSNATGDGRRDGNGCTYYHGGNERFQSIVAVIGIGVGLGMLVLLATSFWLYRELKKRKLVKLKQRFFKQNGGLLLEQEVSSGKANIENTKIFITEDLERATDNFNESRILGSGGFGTVYKGMLSDGRIVAIKKSKVVDKSQIGQFINELVILSHINHKNIVRLFGCCLETEVPLLAYEFISNGTLSHHLHDEDHKSSLSWETRLRIATEIAEALSYMHSSASRPIFHRDIKTCNILLDENFRAKIADFGISRSVPYEKTHLTTLVQGTFGYLDPEYFRSSQFTEKSDVYSFGVVLVELLTGKKPVLVLSSEEVQNSIMHFRSSMKESRVFEIVETRVLNEGGKEEVLTVAKLAKRCLKSVGKKRPTMKEVTTELEGLRRFQEKQFAPQNLEETKNWVHESSSVSSSYPETEDTELVCNDE